MIYYVHANRPSQAVVNQDTTGDAALLRKEILRLRSELAEFQTRQVRRLLPSLGLLTFKTSIELKAYHG
jgi:hypothetical protein